MNNTILIIDDVMLNIDILDGILSSNYTIMAATSGEDAIKLLGRKKPDLVLLDIYMPGIDGIGVLKFMKEQKELANIPVIFVTGEHDVDTEEKGLLLGAVDYIKKPYNASIVKAKVRNHLELKDHRDNLELLVYERTKELEERTVQLEKRTKQLIASREAIIMGMSLMSECHDKVTGTHVERIKVFTKLLSKKMVELYPDIITSEMAEQITLFSPLHDVGKVSIPDRILKKEGMLTDEEFNEMKMHTVNAAELLKKTELFFTYDEDINLRVAIEIAQSHHEKYNGTGYPQGLKGEEIPLSARIVTIADVYDAIRSKRPYKKAIPHKKAVNIILSGDNKTKPSQFDPKVLNAFYNVQVELEKAYKD